MTVTVEKHIQKMLSTKKGVLDIAKSLLKKKAILDSKSDFLSACAFAYHAGLYQLIIKTTISHLERNRTIPWGCLLEVLAREKIQLSQKKESLIVQVLLKQKEVVAFMGSQSWDKKYHQIKDLKFKEIDKINRKTNHTFVSLMEDLDFIQSQGVLKKEKDILKKLRKVEPENPIILKKWLNFQERWGRHLISEKKKNLLGKSKLTRLSSSKKEDQEIMAIVQSINEILKSHSEKRYNMALLFSFAGYPAYAMQLLKEHLDTDSAQWLYLDLLLQSQLYLDGLSFIDMLEEQYNSDPEKVFDLTYMRAKIYYGIGKKEDAKEILRELLAVRPNYRMTYDLLKQWEQEE